MTDTEKPEETPERNGGCAGVAVITAAALGLGAAFYAVSRDLLIIAIWFTGFVLLYRAARKRDLAAQDREPLPHRPSERGSEEEPQVTVVRDQSHPNRWLVTKPSRWMTADTDKTGTES